MSEPEKSNGDKKMKKPTYEELEKHAKELKKTESERKWAEEVLRESGDFYRNLTLCLKKK